MCANYSEMKHLGRENNKVKYIVEREVWTGVA